MKKLRVLALPAVMLSRSVALARAKVPPAACGALCLCRERLHLCSRLAVLSDSALIIHKCSRTIGSFRYVKNDKKTLQKVLTSKLGSAIIALSNDK